MMMRKRRKAAGAISMNAVDNILSTGVCWYKLNMCADLRILMFCETRRVTHSKSHSFLRALY
jgi:hypothetical protein